MNIHRIDELVFYLQAGGSVVLLVGFVVATTIVQQRATSLAGDLVGAMPADLKATKLWISAKTYFDRRSDINYFTSAAHWIPVWFLILVVGFCSLVSYAGAPFFRDISIPSYVLGGPVAASLSPQDLSKAGREKNPATEETKPETTDPNRLNADTLSKPSDGDQKSAQADRPQTKTGGNPSASDNQKQYGLIIYQSTTVFVGSMAFLGAYINLISRLVTRINTDDMSPVSYYFLSVRILSACLVAGIARHIIEALPYASTILYKHEIPFGLAVLGFLIGWSPTLWIDELLLKSSALFQGQIPTQRMPAQDNMPESLSLSMIQGLADQETERLLEININNSETLARANPFIIWVKTRYSLELIVDWIAQAQLFTSLEGTSFRKLREIGIRDVFGYHAAISLNSDVSFVDHISGTTGLNVKFLQAHAEILANDPAFCQLRQLRDVLKKI